MRRSPPAKPSATAVKHGDVPHTKSHPLSKRGLGDALTPTPWQGPPPGPTPECAAWTLSADGTTYTCSQPIEPKITGKRLAQYALIAAGFVAGAVAYQKRSLPAYVAANAASLAGSWWLYADSETNIIWPVLSTALSVAGGALDVSRWRKT